MIIRPPENQTVLENAEVRIPCEGQAEPANLTVKWYKDGIPVHKMGTLGQRTSILGDGTLQIRLITSEDNGWYTCEITNGIGRSITERAYINVECKQPIFLIQLVISTYHINENIQGHVFGKAHR